MLPNVCEGEDCRTSFAAIACLAAPLHRAPSDSSPVVATVARGDTVPIRRRDLHLLQPGIVVVRKRFTLPDGSDAERAAGRGTRFDAGDTLYLLHYGELGEWTWWRHGRRESGDEFWASPPGEGFGENSKDSSRAVASSWPQSTDWWLVAPAHGATGWWRSDSLGALRDLDMMEHWDEHCPAPAS